MQRLGSIQLTFLLVFFLAGCASSTAEQTLIAQNQALDTQVANLHTTATVEADRMLMTIEFVETAIGEATHQRSNMRGTLIARGTDPAVIDSFTPQAGAMFIVSATPLPQNNLGGATVFAPTSEGARTPTGLPQEQVGIIATPTATITGGAALFNIVMSGSVGADDCATSVTTQFTTSTVEIYVVATASNVPPGTILLSRWFYEGTEQITHDFTPDFEITQACIWFYIDQSEVAFSPGNWSVQLEINGVPAGAPVPFSITG